MGATWHERLESCRNAVEALEYAEDEVGRQYRLEDRIGLMQAERDWNERRVEAVRRIRDTFAALELAHELTIEQMEVHLPELKKLRESLSKPPVPPIQLVRVPRPLDWEIIIAIIAVGTVAVFLFRGMFP